MREIQSSHERDVSGEAPPFKRGKCSACGGRAQRRMHEEHWFHVDIYDDYTIHRAVACPKGGLDAHFVPEVSKSRRKKFAGVEPHYREVEDTVIDYDHVDEDGRPDPKPKIIMRPVLCTCTSTSCPGWGVPLPQEIKDLRAET